MKKHFQKIASFALALVVCVSTFVVPAHAAGGMYDMGMIAEWLALSRADVYGEFGSSGRVGEFGSGRGGGFGSNRPQNYYTTPTESVEDKYGNVTNYFRGGDTTSTKIIDSYNHTFNNIWNTNNTTNNYQANVKLNDFLNTYTTNNNNYTYNTQFKSWYYDQTKNTLNYSDDDTYYAYDNRQYFVSIDNSTDEYYLIDVQYSPTFVTVNYDYSTTNNNTTNNYGDVTNVYYFELTDGRNSSTLSASEVAGLDLGYDVANYVLVPDDPNTLSLQHFDGNYEDSSSYGRTFYSENRSTSYVDSGAFGQAVKLPSGSAAGITIPGLTSNQSLSIDFRIYFADVSNLGIYLGNENLFQYIPYMRKWTGKDIYDDNGKEYLFAFARSEFVEPGYYTLDYLQSLPAPPAYPVDSITNRPYIAPNHTFSSSFESQMEVPTSYLSPKFTEEDGEKRYGWFDSLNSAPILSSSKTYSDFKGSTVYGFETSRGGTFKVRHYVEKEYRWSPAQFITADFPYDTYKNQWVSMRIVLSGGKLYYFVNGDCVGSGNFTKPTADKFYIKSSGTVYLDELRITTGDMVSTEVYTPSNEPFDTNMVLALPDELAANTIYVRHSTPVSAFRIGGVRPSNPTAGFFYIPLHDDYTGGQPQLYDGSNWVDVEAMVYDGSATKSALGYKFAPVGSSPDVDTDLQPGRPTKPGEDVDQSTCTHTWEATGRKDPTCTLNGAVEYTCSKCKATKSEAIAALGHTWEVKTKVETTYDDSGNVVTQGFTIYKCSVCQEEYKDTDGKGPPQVTPPADTGGDNWFTKLMKKLGDLLGTTVGGLLELIGTMLGKVLDSLISIVTTTIEKLKEVVNLFGSFGDAMGVFWSWLPPEIVTVLVLGVTVLVFLAIIRIFLK